VTVLKGKRMSGPRTGALAVILVLVGAIWPAAAADREQEQIMADLRILQEQTQQLQQMMAALSQALSSVNGRLDEQVAVTRKAFADQKLLIDTLSGDVRIVREKLDDTNVRIVSLSQELDALRQSIPRTLSSLQQAAPGGDQTALGTDPSASGGIDAAPTAPPAPGVSPQRLFDTAWADYTAGQWALAIAGFDTYIKSFPRSELADDAQTYIGASHLLDGKYDEAVAAFNEVITTYPDGDAVPEAYYKRGLALERLDQPDQARESYQTVIDQYPESQSSRLAAQALDRLSRPSR
jgi:tol-pal system protein YbgF